MLDALDKRLLDALQRNAHFTAHELGEQLGLSPSQAGRRRQRLEAEGYISRYRASLNAERLGLSVQAFVNVHLVSHGPENAKKFSRLVKLRPEITGAWALTGDADYLLRVFCCDLGELNQLIHAILLPHDAVARVQSQIVMHELKEDAPLPIDSARST